MGKDNEEDEFKQLWSLFKDEPQEVREKRQEITKTLNDNELSSFPDTMFVSTAFDELFQCFSVGGQVKNFYRYGKLSYCEEQREKLWFSLRYGKFFDSGVNSQSTNEVANKNGQKIQEFYKNRMLQEKAKGSSEDIWQARKKPLINPFKE